MPRPEGYFCSDRLVMSADCGSWCAGRRPENLLSERSESSMLLEGPFLEAHDSGELRQEEPRHGQLTARKRQPTFRLEPTRTVTPACSGGLVAAPPRPRPRPRPRRRLSQ